MSTQPTASNTEARTSSSETAAGRYLTFELSGQNFGITIRSVREIIAFQDTTPMAGTPDYVDGVINLRGRIIPVIDLGRRLSFQSTERTERTCIIVAELGSKDEVLLVGCIVDTVSEVVQLTADQIEAPPQLGPSVDMGSILALAKVEDSGAVVSLLDIRRILGPLSGSLLA